MNNTIDPTKYTRNQHLGKFEGEPPATEYFWEQMGDGEIIYGDLPDDCGAGEEYCGQEPPSTAEIFHINAEESEAFNLPIGFWFMITEDSQGFVYGSSHASREAAEQAFRAWLGL